MRVKVFPHKDFFIAFLATRDINVVDDRPDILHYFGNSFKEIQKLARAEKPDMVVINSPLDIPSNAGFLYVYDPVSKDQEIYNNKAVKTNALKICKMYYGKLGIQRDINLVERVQKDGYKGDFVRRIFNIMHWA